MTQGRCSLVIEGYELASDAAARLGVTQKQLVHMARKGLIPGARQVSAGRGYWFVPEGCQPVCKAPEGYQWTADAAARMGLSVRRLGTLLYEGRIEGAYRAQYGKRWLWLVPVDAPRPVQPREGRQISTESIARERRPRQRVRYTGHCDRCGIILTRSGDDKHANDRPDAGRCWSCREEYGLGPLAPEITMDGGDACTPTGGFTRLQQRCAAGPV